jgi:Mor family transcriptional regulator
MLSCPNINLQDWKDLESAVGTFEAYRDYLETDGQIRTPEQVSSKLAQRKSAEEIPSQFSENPSFAELYEFMNKDKQAVLGTTVDQLKNARAIELANKLSNALGINYEVVSEEQAYMLTKDTRNPWNGEAAFFVQGQVFFIENRMTSDMVLHEFAHPLVRALSKENPEVFNNIYKKLMSTEEGRLIYEKVKENYTALEPDSDYFKEEVIVKALERAASDKLSEQKVENKFLAAIKEILYALKQFLRNNFGKDISISKLDVDTTLDQLADILTKGDKITIDTQLVAEENLVAYNKDSYDEVTSSLDNIRNKDIQKTINTFFDTSTNHLSQLMKNNNFEELRSLLTDDYLRGDLQEIKSNLQAYQSSIKASAEKLTDDMKEEQSRSIALANSLFRLEDVMAKIEEHLSDVETRKDTTDNLNKAYYYKHLIDDWESFINHMEKILDDPKNNIPGRSPIRALIADIKSNITKSQSYIKDIMADGARDALYEQLEPLNRNVAKRYEDMIADMTKKGASPERINAIFKEYHGMTKQQLDRFNALMKLKKDGDLSLGEEAELNNLAGLSQKGLSINKDKIEMLLKGSIGDANWFNSYLEGYLYNTDPVVGGLALYVKNALNDMMIVSQQKFNAFAEDIRQDLLDAGYNPTNKGKLGQDLGFKDKVARINPKTGELEEREVWTFLHKFKNYRYDVAVINKKVNDALKIYQLDRNKDNKELFLKAVAEQKKFLRTYFYQEYTDDFYKRQELFEKDDIGIEAGYVRENLFERMRLLTESNKSQIDNLSITSELDGLWREYAQIHSRYDLNGNLKTGIEEAIAKRLRDYREASREFYESVDRKGVFENAYFDFIQELDAENLDPALREQRMNEWLKANTNTVINNTFYENRTKVLEQIKVIMSKIKNAELKKELDQTELWQKILEITDGYRDSDGQPIATEISPESIEKLKELTYELEEIKKNEIQRSGLSKNQWVEFNALIEKNKVKRLTGDELLKFQILQDQKNNLSLSKGDIITLNSLYAELRDLSYKEPTTYYLEIVNNYLSKMDDVSALSNLTNSNSIDEGTAAFLQNTEIVEALFEQDSEFEEWFNKNHILKETVNPLTMETEYKYERLYIWSIVKPVDESMYEKYKFTDSTGQEIIIDGVPNMKYKARVVKNKYRTRSIEGVTKDNQGQWLPKSREEMAKNTELSDAEKYKYINEEYEKMASAPAGSKEAALFKLLEKLKTHHLKNQEGLSYSNRLYYDMPRYRMDNLETLLKISIGDESKKRINALTLFVQRIKAFLKGSSDQMEDGLNQQEEFNLVRADIFDNEMTGIPISGLYDIDIDDVSTDITNSMMRYLLSAERQKQLVKISPIVRAIQETVNNPDNAVKSLNDINKNNFMNRGILNYLPKKKQVRKEAVNNFIEKHFEGKNMTGLGSETAWLNNFTNLLFKRASFSFFALNIPSALKNSLGMKFQSMIEASGGKYVTHKSLQQGNVWAYSAMAELSFGGQLYKKGPKSHMMQLIDIFDPVQGRFEEKFGENLSRTVASDAANLSWLYSFRKWVEIQANLQLFGGMLHKKKVVLNGKEIDYIDAFETVNGQIRLKEGIDVRYGIEPTEHIFNGQETLQDIAQKYNVSEDVITEALKGRTFEEINEIVQDLEYDRNVELSAINLNSAEDPTERTRLLDRIDFINKTYDEKIAKAAVIKIDNSEFKFMKNQIQQVVNNMGGAYASFDQPEAQRYLAFRFISYLRRYFTTMAVRRWGFSGPLTDPRPRLNPGLGDVDMGFYITFGKTLVTTLREGGKNLSSLTPVEKEAFLKFTTEVAMLMLATMLMSLLFGWDPEDDERYAKLKDKSGPLNLLGTNREGQKDFDLLGFMEVHTLHMLMQVRAENEQFNLLTGGLKQYNSLLDIKSIAFGPTTDSYVQIWEDTKNIITGNPAGFYTRDVGPYDWQSKESFKVYNRIGKVFGLTGASIDPAMAIQNFQSAQAKIK